MRTGALRATSNAGLQPALDFLFAHTDDPIPDVSAQSQAQPSSSTSRAGGGDEDDEELEALKAVYGKGATGAGAEQGGGEGVEAKVCIFVFFIDIVVDFDGKYLEY